MPNLKYHLINIISVIIFSYATAVTINQIIKYNISPSYQKNVKKHKKPLTIRNQKDFKYYDDIIESGFFKVSNLLTESTSGKTQVNSVSNLSLVGTITGPSSIARALIKKSRNKNPEIFALKRINDEIGNNVYGYKLVKIGSSSVYLEMNGERVSLDLFIKNVNAAEHTSSAGESGKNYVKKNISRAEIKQKVFNNIDNAMRGILAGPYRENGKIVGYRLKRIRRYNILYKLGARSGDIVKRINGHAIDSTEKLYKIWDKLKSEPKITVDIERGGKLLTFDMNITE